MSAMTRTSALEGSLLNICALVFMSSASLSNEPTEVYLSPEFFFSMRARFMGLVMIWS